MTKGADLIKTKSDISKIEMSPFICNYKCVTVGGESIKTRYKF